ncbi:5868_t:CDS:2 [Funneliformis geosporum]|nr:5868_t:CDS:2 [Funneliformis geosporum]
MDYADAFQIATAIECLHNEKIVHRDLVIELHRNTIKLSNFGLSRRIAETSKSANKLSDVIPYIDPERLEKIGYKLDKRSDVYSLSVIFWELSSEYPPNPDRDYDALLALDIIQELREENIKETPEEYIKLYTIIGIVIQLSVQIFTPKILLKKEYTFAFDIYSIGMLMWEISSRQSPFAEFDDYELAKKIINDSIRLTIVSKTPLAYRKLMEQC